MIIWRPVLMSFYDHTGYVQRMEKLARKGWKVVGMNNFAWKLEKIEPTELHYAVTYFPDATEFDPGLSQTQEDYIALCEDAGWHMVAQLAQLVVFCSEEANPVPLETDAEMQVDTIHKAMKRSYLKGQILFVVLAILQLLMQWSNFHSHGTLYLQNNGNAVAVLCWLVVLVLSLTELINYNLWYRKAKAASADGILIPSRSTGKFQFICLLMVLGVTVAWIFCTDDAKLVVPVFVGFAVLFFVVYLLKHLMKVRGVKAGTAKVIFFIVTVFLTLVMLAGVVCFMLTHQTTNERLNEAVDSYEIQGSTQYVYDDALPMTLADLGIAVDETQYSKELNRQESVFLTVDMCDQMVRLDAAERELPNLYYTLTVFKIGLVQDHYNKALLKENAQRNFIPVDAKPWQADAVYALAEDGDEFGANATKYIVFWADRTLYINFPGVPTAEQIATATKLLTEY